MLKLSLRAILMLIFMASLMTACTTAATSQGEPTELTGTISSLNGTVIVVNGRSIDMSNASIPTNLQIGNTVRVTGLQQGDTIVAVVIVLISDSEQAAATATPEAESSPDVESSAEPNASPQATTVVVIPTGEPLIIIEGPIQSITVNTITIFDIAIQVDPADPIMTQIRIGDTIRIAGISSFENNVIIIIAVNITIIETTVIIINNPVYVVPGIPSNCRTTPHGRVTCRRHTGRRSH